MNSNEFTPKKIMIVEDNPVNWKVMQRLIRLLGHESLVVEDGSIVINQIGSYKPDLILMDVQLVGVSGIELTQKIKNDPGLKSLPIIVVTASATANERQKIISESGCNDYIAKPFSPKELSEKISQFFPVKDVFVSA